MRNTILASLLALTGCSSTANRSAWVDQHCDSESSHDWPKPADRPYQLNVEAEQAIVSLLFGWIR